MKLEELARTSSTAARTSVSHLDLPPIGEQSPRSWATPILAAAAVATLVVGGLVIVDRFNSGGQAPADEPVPPVAEVPRLALPEGSGWTVNVAGTGEEISGGGERPTFTYYGTLDTDDPFADGDLLIASFRLSDGDEPMTDGDVVSVRGVDGALSSGIDAGLPDGSRSLEWTERDPEAGALEVILVSQTFDDERLVAVAEALEIDVAANTIVAGADLPLDRIASSTGTPFDAFRSSSDGYLVGYESERRDASLVLSTGRGELEREAVVLQWWLAPVEPVSVNGRPGHLAAPIDEPGSGRPLIWSPVDGVIANLTYFGADETIDLLALAASTVELDVAAWEALTEVFGRDAVRVADFDEVYGRSSGEELGHPFNWVLGIQNGQLCFQFDTESGSTGSCQERSAIVPPEGSAVTVDNGFGEVFGTVVIAADPTVDDVVEVEGRYSVERVEADGVRWFVAIGDTAVQPSFQVLIGGEVVETVEAAVEEMADESSLGEPLPLEVSRAAMDAGLENMPLVARDWSGALPWWVGTNEGDLCLVADGEVPDVQCVPQADVVVFEPVDLDGRLRTVVVLHDLPDCVEGTAIQDADVESSGTGDDPTSRDEVWLVLGESDGWTLELMVSGEWIRIPLQPAAGGTTTDLPADLCT